MNASRSYEAFTGNLAWMPHDNFLTHDQLLNKRELFDLVQCGRLIGFDVLTPSAVQRCSVIFGELMNVPTTKSGGFAI